jgi:acetoin utilization deacetylase AcuC-like enzyme
VVVPVASEWGAQLICISAGYDAHRDDPLAECEVDDSGYGEMAAAIRGLAAQLGVPVLVCLEGGYALGALARSVVATLEALSGDPPPPAAPLEPAAPHRERLARYWPVLERA